MNTIYKYIECTFCDEGVWYVDAWETDNPDEQGTVAARINENTFEVDYTELWITEKGIKYNTKNDDYVRLIVAEKLSELTALYIRTLEF